MRALLLSSIYYLLYNKEFLATLWSIHCYGALKLPPPKTTVTGRIAASEREWGIYCCGALTDCPANTDCSAKRSEHEKKKNATGLLNQREVATSP